MFARNPVSALCWGLLAAVPALARTDMEGCTSSEVITNGGASYIFYVPDTGEICSFLDCGGGRAPPKTTVPGCPLYKGTATVTPSFLPGFGKAPAQTSPVVSIEATATESAAAPTDTSSGPITTPAGASTMQTLVTFSSSAPTDSAAYSFAGAEGDTSTEQAAAPSSSSTATTATTANTANTSNKPNAAKTSSGSSSSTTGSSSPATVPSTGAAPIVTAGAGALLGLLGGVVALL